MRIRYGRFVSCLAMSAVLSTMLPSVAYAADGGADGGKDDGGGIVEGIKGWFSDGDDGGEEKPPPGRDAAVPDREKLPRGKKAPRPERVGELAERRTANARFWKLSDGRVEAEFSTVPTAYRSGKSWKPIDTTVRATDREGFTHANTTNTARTFFGDGTGPLLRVEAGSERTVTFSLTDPVEGLEARAEGGTVTYDGVFGDDTDLRYRMGAGEVKEEIVLTERPGGPVSFAFDLDTEGLTPRAEENGSIGLYEDASREPVMVIPPGFMTDAKKDPSSPYGRTHSTDVAQKLTRDGDGWRLTVMPDADWLAAKERRYPVVVDPTIVIAPTPSQSQDVMILSDDPDTNFNGTGGADYGNWRLTVGTTATGAARSLIRFPLGSIPAGTEIDSARLELYYDDVAETNGFDVEIEAHRATGPWDHKTATWNKAKDLTGELSGTSVTVDDGDSGTTAADGPWPSSTNTHFTQYAVGGDYRYDKDDTDGDAYTWQPRLPEDGEYRVEAHYVPALDRATDAPYTVTHADGSTTHTVDQSAGSEGVWTTLGTHRFAAGTAGKVVLGDGPASSATAVIADAVRFTKPATVTKGIGEYNTWHRFSVTDTVQKWVDGTAANHGFVLKAADESALGRGGPRYQSGEYGYGGETTTYPKLTVVYGRPGAALHPPTTIHGTGAELHWDAYRDPSGASGDDIVEYQVHRSVFQGFTPSAATLVSPVDKDTTSFTDTTATPTEVGLGDLGRAYYYQIAVKTRDGQVIGSPVQLVRLPLAGHTTRIFQAGQSDTTLSSARPGTNLDTIQSYQQQNWLSVGNNSGTYGTTRAVLDFPDPGLPSTARVLDAKLHMWGTITTTGSSGAIYELHALNRKFDEKTATWNNASSTTAWSSPGGDFDAAVSDIVSHRQDKPWRHWWGATSLVQRWVNDPAANKGLLVKLKDESSGGPQERTMFLSSEAEERQLRPQLAITYIDSTTASTYHAPQTPARMIPGDTNTVEVTVTNTTAAEWTAAGHELSYRWTLPDGTDVTTGGNQIATALPQDLVPGESATLTAQVKAPINSDSGNKRTDYVLTWEVRNKATGEWLSQSDGIGGLAQSAAVEDPTSNQLGLEKFYSYAGKNTGAGSTVMNNLYAGNQVWSYNAFSNPGRGLSTFARFSYNSLDTSDTVLGHGWSAQLAAPIRSGAALDFHPNPDPTTVTLPDGDGTAHTFRKQDDGTWKAPAGVHYLLEQKAGVDCKPSADGDPRAWSMTRPDRTRFFFDCDGYLTAIVDKNGNTQTYTYEERRSNNKPVKFLRYITDPAGRQSLTVDYYDKGQDYPYIDDAGVKQSGTKLTSPKIIDHIASMTDVSGRKLTFVYSDKGLLGELTDGAGSAQPKVFKFTYDATQGNKNVKLVEVTDPRGNVTSFDYYDPSEGDDPTFHWAAQTITDRLGHDTGFVYTDPDGTAGSTIQTRVTDAEGNASTYLQDGYGRPTRVTNAKSQTTKLSWDADNNVTRLEENNGAVTTYAYDPKTGYPTETKDAEANADGTPGTVLTYTTSLNGHVADLWRKVSPEGRTWQFGYDSYGNLTSVTDPKGVATTDVADDYTTTYAYDTHGQLKTATDAGGNTTTHGDFGPTGYPAVITDALDNSTDFVYDERGQVLEVTDALGKTTTQTYDTFGRPLVSTVPKDQDKGEVITTPAPVYDANDNVTKATAPNGAVSTAVYNAADQLTEAVGPKDSPTAPERRTTYTYDRTGHVRTTTEPKGNATTEDPDDYTTTNHYNELYQLTSVVNALGDKISYEYDEVGNLVKVVDPKKNATADTTDYTIKYAYDLNHRVTTVMDAAGNTTSRAYDKDSLVVSTTDAENNTTLASYDERGMPTEMKVPHSKAADGTITYRTTRFEYDEVGNTIRTVTPRGTATADPDDFASRTEYDALNRPVKQFQPYDPADARYNDPNVYTQTFYDAVGRVDRISLPPSKGQTVRNDTTYTYFDNGWAKSSTDPWDIVTTYDYNDLGQQTARTLTSADGSFSRTMGWSYHSDGKLRTKTDDGIPVGAAVPLVDNSDLQNVSSTGTWTKAEADGQQGYDHAVHAAGTGTDSFTWTLNIPADGTYTVYVKYPQVADAATSASYTVTHASGTTDTTVDQSAGAGTWVPLGSYTFTEGNDARLRLAQDDSGRTVADGVKLVRDNSADTDAERREFRYAYDLNGNLASIDDLSSGARVDAYTIDYTELNQVRRITESLVGQEKRTTSYTYDANSLPLTITHPEQFSEYTYDLRDLAKTVSVGTSPSDPSPKVSSYTYTDRGLVQREVKGNGNTVDTTYYLDGTIKTTTEKKTDGTLVASHAYTYDPNGNKARDVAKKMNADDHSAYLSSTTDYAYDPADRLAEAIKTGNGAGTETYVHDANANVVSQTVRGTTTTFAYDRNRLLTSTTAGVTSSFNYDPIGRQESVTQGGRIVSRNVYDGFDHVVESRQMGADGTMKSTTYTYDPLDRTASRAVDGETTEYHYLGLSQEVLTEEVAGKLTKSYQYSPWGERLSQIKHNADGTSEDGFYGYNSHTDVETLTDENGDTRATYGYTAYGSNDESEFTGIDKPDPADPTKEEYNSYRYNAKRWDAQSGTYDMGFREYDPGLNRFTTRDMYNGALADMGLGSDPFTGNRYAFTGGNPISNIELDGHLAFLAALAPLAPAVTALAVATVAVVAVLAVAAVVEEVVEEVKENSDEAEEAAEPAPKPQPNGRPRGPETDDDQGRSVDCGDGWVQHGDLDAANGNRSTGVTACLTEDYVEQNPGTKTDVETVAPPGYQWGKRTAGYLGVSPRNNINACHLLGKQLSGSGTQLENLATCSRGANTWQSGSDQGDNNMANYEDQVREALGEGQHVLYTVRPTYEGNRTVPTGFTITAYGTNPDGTPGIEIDAFVPNTLRGRNLGTFNDPNTGAPVPTGSMP